MVLEFEFFVQKRGFFICESQMSNCWDLNFKSIDSGLGFTIWNWDLRLKFGIWGGNMKFEFEIGFQYQISI